MDEFSNIITDLAKIASNIDNSTTLTKSDRVSIKEKLKLILDSEKLKHPSLQEKTYPIQSVSTIKKGIFNRLEQIFLEVLIEAKDQFVYKDKFIDAVIKEKDVTRGHALKLYKLTAKNIRPKFKEYGVNFENRNSNADYYRIVPEYYEKVKDLYYKSIGII